MIVEQQYFEKRRMGFFEYVPPPLSPPARGRVSLTNSLMEGYRKSDALLGVVSWQLLFLFQRGYTS